jgi:hypothetical protein
VKILELTSVLIIRWTIFHTPAPSHFQQMSDGDWTKVLMSGTAPKLAVDGSVGVGDGDGAMVPTLTRSVFASSSPRAGLLKISKIDVGRV